MKSLLLIVVALSLAFGLHSQTTSCGDVFNDTFDEAGVPPSGWTEYSTSGSVAVVNGYLKFTMDKNTPSAYRTFTAVSNNCSCSFDVQGSRTTMNFQMDFVSADGKYIASIALGKGTTDIKYATSMVDIIPGTYTAGVIGTAKFAKNKNYALSMYIDFETQTVDFYNAGVLTLENIPFLETTTDFAKVDGQLLYMYANNGTAFLDNLTVVEASEARIVLANTFGASEKRLSEASAGDYPTSALEDYEQAITDASLVLANCDASAESLVAALEALQTADIKFETKISLIDMLAISQAILIKSSVGDHYVEYPQAAVDAFELVISSATATLADTDATTDNLIAALADLQAAEAVFVAAHNDPVAITLYSAYDFAGEEQEMKCGYYNGSLGAFDNKTVAFQLDSGYMATFAQDVDGLGVSKVYIAQDSDLAINLPADLQYSISFMRVSPWYPVGKKGCLGNVKWSTPDNYNTSWYYNWALTASTSESSHTDVQFVPMSWSAGGDRTSLAQMTTIGQDMTMNHHMAFNEPDNEGQSNMTVSAALAAYPKLLASGLRLGAPGVENVQYSANNDSFNDGAWIQEFMDSCVARGYRVDFIPAHDYVRRTKATFLERFEALHDRYDIPVWVTEYNYGNPNMGSADLTVEKGYANIKGLTEALEGADFVERYNWYYFFGASSGIGGITDGELNITGQFYRDLESPAPSYIQDEYEQGPYIVNSLKDVADESSSVVLYPNPVTGNILNVAYSEASLLSTASVSIYDINGKEVLSLSTSSKQINVSHLSNGFYIVQLESATQKVTKKIIINR